MSCAEVKQERSGTKALGLIISPRVTYPAVQLASASEEAREEAAGLRSEVERLQALQPDPTGAMGDVTAQLRSKLAACEVRLSLPPPASSCGQFLSWGARNGDQQLPV